MGSVWSASLAVIGTAFFAAAPAQLSAQQNTEAVPIGDADFGGRVQC
jgi:hypothetical protein